MATRRGKANSKSNSGVFESPQKEEIEECAGYITRLSSTKVSLLDSDFVVLHDCSDMDTSLLSCPERKRIWDLLLTASKSGIFVEVTAKNVVWRGSSHAHSPATGQCLARSGSAGGSETKSLLSMPKSPRGGHSSNRNSESEIEFKHARVVTDVTLCLDKPRLQSSDDWRELK